MEIPEEFLVCLEDDSEALQFFNSLNESEQYNYIKWIYSAKTEQTKVNRIAQTLVRLSKRKNLQKKNRKRMLHPPRSSAVPFILSF